MIEAETDLQQERNLISGVFHNRLRLGMRLQSDPTVRYGIEKDNGKLERNLTRKDLQYDSPYNTYRNNGLPPSPINNPGKASILAALNPEKTNYIYFVAKGTGGHYFASNYQDHLKNVKKYRSYLQNK